MNAQLWARASLRISPRAKAAVITAMKQVHDFDPVATVSWALDQISGQGADAKHSGPGWGVGFYPKGQIPTDAVTMIEGIPFTFDASSAQRLDGGELDFIEGRFVVRHSDQV